MGLYTPTILGWNSYLSWFYDRGAIKDPAHTGTSKRLSQAMNRGPIRKFLPKYANVYVTIQSHALSAGAQTHYVTANGVRNGRRFWLSDSDVEWLLLVVVVPLHFLNSLLTCSVCVVASRRQSGEAHNRLMEGFDIYKGLTQGQLIIC